jgi:hypothetical protein
MFGPRHLRPGAEQAEHADKEDKDDTRESNRELLHAQVSFSEQAAPLLSTSTFPISVITMTDATIEIDEAAATDTIISVKERLFALNHKLFVRRQRLVHSAGPHGIDPLADDETLGGAGVAQDGSAKLDVLIADLTEADAAELGPLLLDAAWTGRVDDMRALLDEGANAEYKDERGNSAMRRAADGGRADCVRLLLEAGASKDSASRHLTALVRAAVGGHADCVHGKYNTR